MKMEALMLRFPHLPEQIFQKLDTSSLFKCKEVVRSWKNLIDGRNYPWLRVVNIPTILKKRNTYLHLAAETGQIEAFKLASNKEKNINIRNRCGETSFHLACKKGRPMIVEFIMKKSGVQINFDSKNNQTIDLNVKTKNLGITGLGLACENGHSEVVNILMNNATNLRIRVNEKDDYRRTALILACQQGHSDVVKNFIENKVAWGIDFKIEDKMVEAFLAACIHGHSDVVKVFLENAGTFGIDIDNLEDINVEKGLNIALHEGHSGLKKVFLDNTALGALSKNLWLAKPPAKPEIILHEDCVYEKPLWM
jgi:ankyrin repeat protein